METKIHLDEDESMLLLITKNHCHKHFPDDERAGSLEYIQEVCDFRVACAAGKADVFGIYINLSEDLLTSVQMGAILRKYWSNWYNSPNTREEVNKEILNHMISALACLRTTDFIFDKSLMEED